MVQLRDTSQYTIVNLPRAERDDMLPPRDPRKDPLVWPGKQRHSNAEVQETADYYWNGGTHLSPEIQHQR